MLVSKLKNWIWKVLFERRKPIRRFDLSCVSVRSFQMGTLVHPMLGLFDFWRFWNIAFWRCLSSIPLAPYVVNGIPPLAAYISCVGVMLIWKPQESGDVYPPLGSDEELWFRGTPPLGILRPLPASFIFGMYLVPEELEELDALLCDVVDVDGRVWNPPISSGRMDRALRNDPFAFPSVDPFRTIVDA